MILNKNRLRIAIIHELTDLELPNDLEYDNILPTLNSILKKPPVEIILALKNIIEDIWVNKKIALEKNVDLKSYFANDCKDIFISEITNTKNFIILLNYIAISVISEHLELNTISIHFTKEVSNRLESVFRSIYEIFNQIFEVAPSKDELIQAIAKIYDIIPINELIDEKNNI